MREVFEVEMFEVGFVIHSRFEAVIDRMKLDDGVIDAIETRLVYKIQSIPVTYAGPR